VKGKWNLRKAKARYKPGFAGPSRGIKLKCLKGYVANNRFS
jgi:hypothetical protein